MRALHVPFTLVAMMVSCAAVVGCEPTENGGSERLDARRGLGKATTALLPSPATRTEHAAVWRRYYSDMVVFGGDDGEGLRQDVWRLADWAWRVEGPSGERPVRRYGHSLVDTGFDLLVFGGESSPTSSIPRNDVWMLRQGTGELFEWFLVAPAETPPPARADHAAVWTEQSGSPAMLVFGGRDAASGLLNDIWALRPSGTDLAYYWWQLNPEGVPPPPRADHTAVWNSSPAHMVVYGGRGTTIPAFGDVWVLDYPGDDGAWERASPSGMAPPARYSHSAVWAGPGMLVFGGLDESGRILSDVWLLTTESSQADGRTWAWTELNPAGTPPSPRENHSAAWHSLGGRNGEMIVFGGSAEGGRVLDDVHVLTYSAADDSWTWSSPDWPCEPDPPVPVLVSPEESAAFSECGASFSWSVPQNVMGYHFDIVVNGTAVGTTTGTSFDLPATHPLLAADNEWLVRATGCPGTTVATGTRTFTVTPPPPAAPALVTQSDLVCDTASERTFVWEGDGTSVYDLIVNGERVRRDLTEPSVALPSDFPYELANSWQVAARNCLGVEALSDVDSFVLTSAVELQAPTITSPANDSTVYCDATIAWTYPGSTHGITFDILTTDGDLLAEGVTSTSWSPAEDARLGAGTYALRVRARNCVGDTALSGARLFSVDNTPSAPRLDAPVAGAVTDGTPTFVWSSSAPQHTDVVYDLTLDGTLHAAGLTEQEFAVPTSAPLLEGDHTWAVAARGCLDATAVSETRTFTVDTTGPDAFSLTGPGDGTWYGPAEPTVLLRWELSGDHPAGVERYDVLVDDAIAASNDPTATDRLLQVADRAEGLHAWNVLAVDRVGNVTASDETWAFGVDRSAPGAFGLVSPADGALTSSSYPVLSWSAAADQPSGVHHYELLVDGATSVSDVPNGQLSATPRDALSDGTHSWRVVAVDRAGNRRESTEMRSVVVDRTPPSSVTLVDVRPRGTGDWVVSTVPTFVFTAADNVGGSGIDLFDLLVDGQPDGGNPIPAGSGVCAPNTCRDSFDVLDEGPHTWSVVAYDRAGVSTPSAQGSFVVEMQPPRAFAHNTPADGATVLSSYPRLCWERATDVGAGVAEYRVAITRPGLADVDIVVPADGGSEVLCVRPAEALSGETHVWLVTAVDRAGRETAANGGVSWSFTVEADSTPPDSAVTVPAADGDLVGCRSYVFEGTATDFGAGVARVEVQIGGTSEDSWQVAMLGGLPADAERPWTWEWSGTGSQSGTLHVRAVDREENVQSPPAVREFDVDCVGPTAFDLVSPPDGSFVPSCPTLSWEPSADDQASLGRYELRVRASGGETEAVVDAGLDTSYTLEGTECLAALVKHLPSGNRRTPDG